MAPDYKYNKETSKRGGIAKRYIVCTTSTCNGMFGSSLLGSTRSHTCPATKALAMGGASLETTNLCSIIFCVQLCCP